MSKSQGSIAACFCKSLVLACGLLLFTLFYAGVLCASTTILATGVGGGVGVALDRANNHLFWVEYTTGTLKRMQLTPDCEAAATPTCTVTTVVSGLIHPEGLAIDVDHGVAYVTTRDDPGTTGKLWRISLTSGARSVVTFNLDAPQQLVLDAALNTAYTVGYDSGKLWRIDLTTGVKTALTRILQHPVGLALSNDRTYAYVTEQTLNQTSEINLSTGVRVRSVTSGMVTPFFLAWTDPAAVSLYAAERDPANRITRIDIPSVTHTVIADSLPYRPTGIANDYLQGVLYVTTNDQLIRISLGSLALSEPVFLGVGLVPSTSIVNGYATTDPSNHLIQVTDSPFGGTLTLFGNLSNFKALGATHYRVIVTAPDGSSSVITRSWDTSHWNSATDHYDPATITPEPGGYYEIPTEYPTHPERWYPSFEMIVWPSSVNGLHRFSVELYSKSGTVFTAIPLPAMPDTRRYLTVLIDNTPPDVDLTTARQHGPGPLVSACAIVTGGTHVFDFEVTANDPNQHLLSYTLTAYWAKDQSENISGASDSYSNHLATAPLWSGVVNQWMPASGWSAHCDCAHTFVLGVWKRTIDGYNYTLYRQSNISITIINTSTACTLP